MIRLAATNQKLQVVLAGSVATSELPVVVCYSDKSASGYDGGAARNLSNGTTPVDVCPAPGSSTVRDIDYVNVRNSDTASVTVTVQIDDGGTAYVIFDVTMDPGDILTYTHASGWELLDNNGNVHTILFGAGTGTVTTVSVTTANGVSGTVSNPTTTPAITLTLGAITPTSVNGLTISTSTGTLTISNGKTLSVSNTLTFAGADGTTMTFPSTSATIARTDAGNTFTGHQTIEGVTSTGATGTGKFVFDASPTFTGTPAAPTAAGGTNTTQIATTAFVAAAVASAVTGLLEFQGATDCSGNPNYPAASKGDAYIVSVAGKIGGASGTSVEVGDWFVATADNAGGTEASVGSSWGHMEHNLVGALLASNNLSDLANAATAVNNLGGASSTGSGGLVRATSPSLTTPALGTPSSGTLTNCDGTASSLTAGKATILATARSIYGNNFDGSAALTQVIASTYGGTGNGFTKFSGPATSEKTFTLPNASATVLTDNAAVTVAQGGSGAASFTAYAVICGGTTSAGALQNVSGVGTAGQVLTSNGAGALPTWQAASSSGGTIGVIVLQDQKTAGSAGGTFSSGAWRTRTLNTEVVDTNNDCSLSSNQFTLTAGTYEVFAIAPAVSVDSHQIRIQNTTDSTTILTGSTEGVASSFQNSTNSVLIGRFTIAASKALELQHQCQTTKSSIGFGSAAGFTTEVYATVWLRRVA